MQVNLTLTPGYHLKITRASRMSELVDRVITGLAALGGSAAFLEILRRWLQRRQDKRRSNSNSTSASWRRATPCARRPTSASERRYKPSSKSASAPGPPLHPVDQALLDPVRKVVPEPRYLGLLLVAHHDRLVAARPHRSRPVVEFLAADQIRIPSERSTSASRRRGGFLGLSRWRN